MGLLDALKKAQEQQKTGSKESPVIPSAVTLAPNQQVPAAKSAPGARDFSLLSPEIVHKILDNIDDLPTLPTVAKKVMDELNNPQSNAKDIADIIKNDQAITAKILKVGNSAYYAGYSPCTTVQGAVTRIGFLQIKRMILSISILDTFSKFERKNFNLKEFWTHSIATGYASRIIGKLSGFRDSDDLFTAGLLHDLGKLITLRYLPDLFDGILKKMEDEQSISYFEAEKGLSPVTHCDIGSWLAIKWNMSRDIQNVIYNHHLPPFKSTLFEKDVIMFSSIVYLANKIVKSLNLGLTGDKACEHDPEIFDFVFRGRVPLEKLKDEILKEKPVIEAATAAL